MKKNIWLIIGLISLVLSFLIDRYILLFFNSIKLGFLDLFFIIIDFLGKWYVVLIFISALFLVKYRKLVLPFWIGFVLNMIINVVLKTLIARPRTNGAVEYFTFTNIVSYAFPSGHVMAVFFVLPFLKGIEKKLWLIFVLLTVISRLYLGIHYLSDVIAGALIGYFVGVFIFQRKEKIIKMILR